MTPLFYLAVLSALPQTHAEKTQFKETGRYAEVEQLCGAYQKAFPKQVKCTSLGDTPQGRKLWALVVGDKKNPTVMFQGGIHAGEIDGKDAGFWVLRELFEGKSPLLSKLCLVFVPIFNVDGHERFGPYQRPNQNGPEQMGWRVTANNLNLNRDYTKADAPEMQAMLRALHTFNPILYVDLHVTDGAKFQPDISVTLEPRLTGDPTLRALGQALSNATLKSLEKSGHQPLDFYPSFVEDDDPRSGFGYGIAPPRFSNSYWAQHNRFGVLVETHSWKDYATRVKATHDALLALFEQAAEHGAAWEKASRDADKLESQGAGAEQPLLYQSNKHSRQIVFQGYAYTQEPSPVSGAKWLRYDDTKPQPWTVPFFDEVEPSLKIVAPKGGYLVPPEHAGWVAAKLDLHGIKYTKVAKTKPSAPVDSFRVKPKKFSDHPYEGRQTVQLDGEWKDDARDVLSGSLFVPSAQPRLRLLMQLFEPHARDSFLQWGFFNAHLEEKEYMEAYVAEEVARKMLEDPKVKTEFDARAKDFKTPEQRLHFFYEKHASYDERLNLYPVFRTDESY